MWSVYRINHRTHDYGAGGYSDECQWALTYNGTTRQDVDKVLSAFRNTIENGLGYGDFYRIAAWRFNWRYIQPDVQPNTVPLISGLPAATYSIRVSGLDVCGNESAASLPVLVTLVAPSNSIRIRVLRAPALSPIFRSYNIYVNNHLEVSGLVQPGISNGQVVGGSNSVYAIALLTNLLGTGAAPVENPVPVRWRFVRIDTYTDALKEDEEQDGLFNGNVVMETTTFQERDQPQADMVRVLGINLKVYPTNVPVVPASSSNILSTNQITVNVSAG